MSNVLQEINWSDCCWMKWLKIKMAPVERRERGGGRGGMEGRSEEGGKREGEEGGGGRRVKPRPTWRS